MIKLKAPQGAFLMHICLLFRCGFAEKVSKVSQVFFLSEDK
ncbi:hypothetical protein PTUN_a2632 [Pseudoalteromonas tunicata]|nr:hypothetical protein PTUN_a2632 [Pseudoalteromonas tunicata]